MFPFVAETLGIGNVNRVCDYIAERMVDSRSQFSKSLDSAPVDFGVTLSNHTIQVYGMVQDSIYFLFRPDFVREKVVECLSDIGYDESYSTYYDEDSSINLHSVNILSRLTIDNSSHRIARNTGAFNPLRCRLVKGYACCESGSRYFPKASVLSNKLAGSLSTMAKGLNSFGLDLSVRVIGGYPDERGLRRGDQAVDISAIQLSVPYVYRAGGREIQKDVDCLRDTVMGVLDGIPLSIVSVNGLKIDDLSRAIGDNPHTKHYSMGGVGVSGRFSGMLTYGGMYGGQDYSFIGKDWSKFERNGQFLARYLAKNLASYFGCGFEVGLVNVNKQNSPDVLIIPSDISVHSDAVKLISELDLMVYLTDNFFLQEDDGKSEIVDLAGLMSYGYFGHVLSSGANHRWEKLDLFK